MIKKIYLSGLDIVVGQIFKYPSRCREGELSIQIISNKNIRDKTFYEYRAAVYVINTAPDSNYYIGLVNVHGKNDIPELTEEEYMLVKGKLKEAEKMYLTYSSIPLDKLSKGVIKEYK